MTVKDSILFELGIGIEDDILDRICESFDVELNSYDIKAIIHWSDDLSECGNAFIGRLYEKVIENAVDLYNLNRNDFSYYCNSLDSNLFYRGERIRNSDELEYICSVNFKE